MKNQSRDQFPEGIKFKYPWRNYQHRVLKELDEHLKDNHLHIVAPPGSGKTVLGLEVAVRLNNPTLILAPTVAIRNQWVQRFCELFLQSDHTPDWISRDIKNPKFLTVSTYQGLHSACTESANSQESEVIKLLLDQKVKTIVVDEAHHLKNAWWESLTKVKKALNPTVVGLTATPPYDVSYNEWQRYIELNGPVDAEISVPELVVEGDLCPHQDYVYLSFPTHSESQNIEKYKKRIANLFNELTSDPTLFEALKTHPIFLRPEEHLEWIYLNLEYYSATLIYLNAVGAKITAEHKEVIGDSNLKVPKLNYDWLEILLTFYLYKDEENFESYQEHRERTINKLKRGGAIERRSIRLSHSKKINKKLTTSLSKLESINKIVKFENESLGNDLRMVVLTDYIRKEYLVDQKTNDLLINKLGVMPIFEKIRRVKDKNQKLGVLTGSLVIIPRSAHESLTLETQKFNQDGVTTSPLPYDNDYLIIHLSAQLKHDIVHIITRIFEKGDITVLIGTKSLLGEGWDAPSINSLILASFVGSYVLSNQMRGRAIRTEKKNKTKTGNIWHLVCVDPSSNDGGDDLELLRRRFKAFVGVSLNSEASIENGIERLGLPDEISSLEDINASNDKMLNDARDRHLIEEKWQKALESGSLLIEEMKIPFPKEKDYRTVKQLYYNRTIGYMAGMLGSGLATFGLDSLYALGRSARHIRDVESLKFWLMGMGVLGILLFGRLTFTTFRSYIKYRDISKDVHQIGNALLVSLIDVKAIRTASSQLKVVSEIDQYGAVYCHLEGGTTFEKSVFIKSLQEVISTVENPRYLIIRKSFLLKVISQKDYHAVPDLIGKKKEHAIKFASNWKHFVGSCALVFTRTIKGRKLLLKSRIDSLSSQFENKSERINKWR